jgi:hypothetical protein
MGGLRAGGFIPSEIYESVGRTIPYIWKNKKCSKPPTSYIYIYSPINQGIIYPSTTHHFAGYIRLLLMAIVLPTSNSRHISENLGSAAESPWVKSWHCTTRESHTRHRPGLAAFSNNGMEQYMEHRYIVINRYNKYLVHSGTTLPNTIPLMVLYGQ